MYLRCVLFRDGCKGTSKLNLETNLITSIHSHNHNVEKYKTEVYELKAKCKTMARKSQTSLRRVFDDVTRGLNPGAFFQSRDFGIGIVFNPGIPGSRD